MLIAGQRDLLKRIQKLEAQGKSAGDKKEQFQKMAKDMAANVAKGETNMNALAKRVEDMEKEAQERRAYEVKWTPSQQPANPYEHAYKHMFRAEQDEQAIYNKIRNASEDEVKAAVNVYGNKIPHKGDLRAIMFPRRHKALLTALSSDASGSAGATLTPEYMEQILEPAQEKRTLLDEFRIVNTKYTKLIWRQEKLSRREGSDGVSIQSLDFTGTGQGTTGTEVEFQFESKEEEMRTFLGLAYSSIQILQDVSYMQTYVGNQLEYEANRQLSISVLYGENARGASDTSKQFSTSALNIAATEFDTDTIEEVDVSGTHLVDVLSASWLQASLTHIDPTVHFMHPTDYHRMLLTKDNDGRYMFVPNINNPSMLSPMGMPVAKSTFVNKDSFFTLPANECMLCVRKGWESGMFFEDNTNVRELEVTFRVYGRYGFVMFRPGSTIRGTFSSAIAA